MCINPNFFIKFVCTGIIHIFQISLTLNKIVSELICELIQGRCHIAKQSSIQSFNKYIAKSRSLALLGQKTFLFVCFNPSYTYFFELKYAST